MRFVRIRKNRVEEAFYEAPVFAPVLFGPLYFLFKGQLVRMLIAIPVWVIGLLGTIVSFGITTIIAAMILVGMANEEKKLRKFYLAEGWTEADENSGDGGGCDGGCG